jgi:catechol 2,3-dioxygenase-like lactoylglutathione lyase family enzyme
MAHIVATQGSPLAAAVLSCERLEATQHFYCERLGFDAGPVLPWHDPALAVLTACATPVAARACLLTAANCPVGQILLLEFNDPAGQPLAAERIHPASHSRAIGLNNLNFYTEDIAAATAAFRALGYEFWTEPTRHTMTAGVGTPIEVLFDGPDGVAINFVELATADPQTRIGQMRAYVAQHGRTHCGFTPVVTSSHVVRDLERARMFYERVLRMGVLIDEELSHPATNAFLRLPADARTRVTFMQGNHMFGKLALSHPLNYLDQCIDLAPRGHAPNRGYLAQVFEVADIGAAYWACREVGAPGLTTPTELEIPGFGRRRGLAVRNPGSGALQWLLSRA